MSTRFGVLGLLGAGLIAVVLLPGCGGGGTPAVGDAAVVEPPKGELDYQQQQEKLRKENMSRNKTGAKGTRR